MNKPSFETVVTDHGPTVLRVCLAVLGPSEADAWSETFLSARKAYPELPADANIEAWLVTITHRKAIDVTRAAARRAIPVDLSDALAYCDMTTSPTGCSVSVGDRLSEIRQRYGPSDVVTSFVQAAESDLLASVA